MKILFNTIKVRECVACKETHETVQMYNLDTPVRTGGRDWYYAFVCPKKGVDIYVEFQIWPLK